jgi:cell division transport system permease protein
VSAVGYSFEEALASLRRSGRSALISIGTIAVAFLTLGGFLLLSANLQRVIQQWMDAAEVSVYVTDDSTAEARAAIEQLIREHPAVAGVEFISKEQALQRFKTEFPELADVTTSIDANPFPASFEVQVRADAGSASETESLATALSGKDGVADVQYDRRWLARVLAMLAGVRLGGLAIATVLMLGAAFTAAAVVRLSLHARRDELDIMQLVGAPFTFIRGPFVVEGMALGGAGAIVALVALWILYRVLSAWAGADLAGLLGSDELRFLGLGQLLLVVAAGFGVGALAGTVASRAAR